MDAALEEMLSLRKARDVESASLEDARPGHRDVLEATVALRNGRLAMIEGLDESATELRHLRERVGLTALIDDRDRGPFRDRQMIGLEVPSRIGSSGVRLADQLVQRRRVIVTRQVVQRDVVAEARSFLPERGVEGPRIAFVQCHHLDVAWRDVLRDRPCRYALAGSSQ